MLETSALLLRLLSLLQARRDWTSAELATRLGVTTRTIRNDVYRLRGLGYPADARPGVAGGEPLCGGGGPAPSPSPSSGAGAAASVMASWRRRRGPGQTV